MGRCSLARGRRTRALCHTTIHSPGAQADRLAHTQIRIAGSLPRPSRPSQRSIRFFPWRCGPRTASASINRPCRTSKYLLPRCCRAEVLRRKQRSTTKSAPAATKPLEGGGDCAYTRIGQSCRCLRHGRSGRYPSRGAHQPYPRAGSEV